MCYFNCKTNSPHWREVSVVSHLPDELKKLPEIAWEKSEWNPLCFWNVSITKGCEEMANSVHTFSS